MNYLTRLSLLLLLPLVFTPREASAQQSLTNSTTQPLVHPGGWHTEADLERIRAKVAAGEEPWKSAWAALEKSDAKLGTKPRVPGPKDDPATYYNNNYFIQWDGHAAYVLAVKWVASGDNRYATNAIAIINAWVTHAKSIGNEPMRSGIGGSQMAQAAEILAHGFHAQSGWSPSEVKAAQQWFKTVVYPHPNAGASANWGTSAMSGIMSMSVFCDDREMFNRALDVYKHGFLINGSLKGGCCAVTQYIDATGENAESGRDQPHSQGGIAHLLEVALVGWNQGLNLIAYNDDKGILNYGSDGSNRLWRGLEYTAKYNLGNEVPYHPFYEYCNNVTKYPVGPSATNRGHFSPIWEMARRLFENAKLDAPYCKQVTELQSYTPESSNSDHPGLGTLTMRTNAK